MDLRYCQIKVLEADGFKNLPALEKLFISNNELVEISCFIFNGLNQLTHLDLSYNMEVPTTANNDYSGGLTIPKDVFSNLKNLKFLDLSHTKLNTLSTAAFSRLGKNLQQLSLCYTFFPTILDRMFENTNLKVLDLSGNPSISLNLKEESLQGLKSLEILSFESSNVQNLDWLKCLKQIHILLLKKNNIGTITNKTFEFLSNLKILDLSSNRISSWNQRILEGNGNLSILNLRDNNINMMTSEMIDDFFNLDFLAIGMNNFICNCILRDFFDMAASNNKNVNCTIYIPNVEDKINYSIRERRSIKDDLISDEKYLQFCITEDVYMKFLSKFEQSYRNMIATKEKYHINYVKYSRSNINEKITNIVSCQTTGMCTKSSSDLNSNETDMSFSFQLIDFNENDYSCFNSSTNQQYFFHEVDPCALDRSNWPNIQDLLTTTSALGKILGIILGVTILSLICYYKWWYIRYFFILVKNATILSFLDKEKDLLDRTTNETDEKYTYDVFVSYCEENRQWVLDELIPNIEKDSEINICLHERDFEVGLSILENIISCMDRSKSLLLVVSEQFLLSHWCQFEMHLAQHR